MRATGIIAGGRLFPVPLSCRASNKALAMLSRMFASPGVNSPSSSSGSGRDGVTPSSPGRGDVLLVSTGWVESPEKSLSLGLISPSFSPSAENRLVSAMAGASGFPAVDVRLVPWLDTIEEEGFEILTFLFFEAEKGVTHSPDYLPGILIECKELEYYCRPGVDANVMGNTT